MTILIIGLVALVIFVIIIAVKNKKNREIPRLETEGFLEKITGGHCREALNTYYIKYQVDGKEYTGMLNPARVKGLAHDTPVGIKVIVLYDPNNPEDVFCELRDWSQVINK